MMPVQLCMHQMQNCDSVYNMTYVKLATGPVQSAINISQRGGPVRKLVFSQRGSPVRRSSPVRKLATTGLNYVVWRRRPFLRARNFLAALAVKRAKGKMRILVHLLFLIVLVHRSTQGQGTPLLIQYAIIL